MPDLRSHRSIYSGPIIVKLLPASSPLSPSGRGQSVSRKWAGGDPSSMVTDIASSANAPKCSEHSSPLSPKSLCIHAFPAQLSKFCVKNVSTSSKCTDVNYSNGFSIVYPFQEGHLHVRTIKNMKSIVFAACSINKKCHDLFEYVQYKSVTREV